MENTEPNAIGDAIRQAREAKGLSRREVGEALSINDQYLYQAETGRRRLALETLWELANFLDLDPHALDPRLASKPRARRKAGGDATSGTS